MTTTGGRSGAERLRELGRVWVDALTYAGAVGFFVAFSSFGVGIATGGGYVRGNRVLFVMAWLVMAYATFRLWPSSPEALENGTEEAQNGTSLARTQAATRFQSLVQALPPNRWVEPPRPERRLSIPGKLFVASVVMFAISYLVETRLGVA